MKKSERIFEQIDARVKEPFVTARFGDNWKEHQKQMLNEGQIDIDIILDIAWRQGRRALLMADAIRELADN